MTKVRRSNVGHIWDNARKQADAITGWPVKKTR